jgi:hypothetical protein
VTLAALLFNVVAEQLRWRSSLSVKLLSRSAEVWLGEKPTSKASLEIVVRNLSYRPTAIVRALAIDDAGKVVSEGTNITPTPIPLEAWGVHSIRVELRRPADNLASVIELTDMDDRTIRVPAKTDTAWKR